MDSKINNEKLAYDLAIQYCGCYINATPNEYDSLQERTTAMLEVFKTSHAQFCKLLDGSEM